MTSLWTHDYLFQPEDGGNKDEALFNCLLACQGPVSISLGDLFEEQEGSGVSSGASSGVGSDRRLVCLLLKLALRRRQLTQLLRSFSTNEEVLTTWYSGTFASKPAEWRALLKSFANHRVVSCTFKKLIAKCFLLQTINKKALLVS